VYQSKAGITFSTPPLARHKVTMGTTSSLKTKAPAVPVRAKIYSSFNKKAPAPQPPTIPAKPVMELKSTSVVKPAAPQTPANTTSQATTVSKVTSNIASINKTSVAFKNGTSMTAVTITSKLSPPATSAAAAAAIAAANQIGSPDSSVSDKDEWGTPEGTYSRSFNVVHTFSMIL
jgi:hypothetical protein